MELHIFNNNTKIGEIYVKISTDVDKLKMHFVIPRVTTDKNMTTENQ